MTAENLRPRLPAEWEEQDGILMAWPHERTDWHSQLQSVERVFVDIAREVVRFERLIVAAPDPGHVEKTLRDAGISEDRFRVYGIETNDTWARDFGPITVIDEGRPTILDFGFNGWGLKYPANLDNRITLSLSEMGAFGDTPRETVGLILEGGSIESDGAGTILTTTECLLSPNRNPHLSRGEIEDRLGGLFGADRFLWLDYGRLAGDDTDSHIDTLARFCPSDTIVHTSCDDPEDEHFEALRMMVEQLETFRTRNGRPYRLIALPWPEPCYDDDGLRLPATYANFLIINEAVLVPAYGSEKDSAALDAVGRAFPDRRVIGVDCPALLPGRGSLHCVTMHLPKGVLS